MLEKLIDFLHKSKIVERFLEETKRSTAAYTDDCYGARRVSTTKSPTRLTYAGSLIKYIIFISAVAFSYTISAQEQDKEILFNTIELLDTTDEINSELTIKDNDSASPDNLSNTSNVEQQELKNCLQGNVIALNKITATSEELLLKVDEPQYFGNIQIKLHKCTKNLDHYNEDNYMLLTITEHKIDEDPMVIFQGWLISSSISVSTFEHPIYEIFAKSCL